MYERILAIGDIHGEWEKFMDLYQKIDFHPEKDLLIFLGDYIDRGPHSLRVLDWMYEHKDEENIIMLRGNHEQMLLDYFKGSENGELWLWNGGDRTRRELREQQTDVVGECLIFLKNLPLKYRLNLEEKTFFFCHAGIDPDVPLDQQEESSLLWAREAYFNHYQGKDVIVTGHTHVSYVMPGETMPIIRDNMIFLDTGAYLPDGKLSCVDVLSGRIWQS